MISDDNKIAHATTEQLSEALRQQRCGDHDDPGSEQCHLCVDLTNAADRIDHFEAYFEARLEARIAGQDTRDASSIHEHPVMLAVLQQARTSELRIAELASNNANLRAKLNDMHAKHPESDGCYEALPRLHLKVAMWEARARAHASRFVLDTWKRVDENPDKTKCACGETWRFDEEIEAGICVACLTWAGGR